jgi:hypothetical protein
MWDDVHREIARQRHADRLREAEHARLASGVRRPRRPLRLRLRLGRLELRWNCAPAREAREHG